MSENVLESRDCARVCRGFAPGGEGVGERVRLELEADLDNVKRRDDESALPKVISELDGVFGNGLALTGTPGRLWRQPR